MVLFSLSLSLFVSAVSALAEQKYLTNNETTVRCGWCDGN
jgi:hypothetical protein